MNAKEMNPKKKAKELINKFDKLFPCEGLTTGHTPIECALIVVEEILYTFVIGDNEILFWQEVKQEIENYEE